MDWFSLDITAAGTYVTGELNMHSPSLVSGEAIFTGDIIGTFFCEVSVQGQVWYRVASGDQIITAPQNHLIEIVGNTTPLIRFGVDVISGSGKWSVNCFNKGA